MARSISNCVCIAACWLAPLLPAQTRAKVDFRGDIQPLFQQHCIECHGPSQQMGGMRLDRRSSAMGIRGGTTIGPGNAEGSRLYLRLAGTKAGQRMPPTGPLTPDQINLIKTWIDQGAEWPDELSGDKSPSPGDPRAVRIAEALRAGDREGFARLLRQDPEAVKLKGAGDSTPLMFAALYGDAESMRQLIERGADVNAANEAGATALIWAVDDADKTRVLLEHGADPNATSSEGATPLLIALRYKHTAAVVKLLLDHGVKPDAKPYQGSGVFAAAGGDEATLRALLDHGVEASRLSGGLTEAVESGCDACVDLLIKTGNKPALSSALLRAATDLDPRLVKVLLDRGADPKFVIANGFTALMLAAVSEGPVVEKIEALISHGADINARTGENRTILDLASPQGDSAVTKLLRNAGAQLGTAPPEPPSKPKPAASARAALGRSIPLLQRSDVIFVKKSGCVSCHNDNLTAMTVAAARKQGVGIDEDTAQAQRKVIANYIEGNRENFLEGRPIAGGADTASYILLGLAAENWPSDPATDAMARYLKNVQRADGSWAISAAFRPPIESSDIEVTAAALRAIQVYGPKARRAEYDSAVDRAADWLAKVHPLNNEDRAFQILGLVWSGKPDRARQAGGDLLGLQRSDGGWAQRATLASDAYATGQALVALRESGVLKISDSAYKRAAQFLIGTQLEDGSWYVRSRSIAFQPYFESGFPHGRDQFISAAATNWAAMALVPLAQ
jgi:ankyrin repeat protein/mono/diheme cytochrome c family protein